MDPASKECTSQQGKQDTFLKLGQCEKMQGLWESSLCIQQLSRAPTASETHADSWMHISLLAHVQVPSRPRSLLAEPLFGPMSPLLPSKGVNSDLSRAVTEPILLPMEHEGTSARGLGKGFLDNS